jgi:hypothetical protein
MNKKDSVVSIDTWRSAGDTSPTQYPDLAPLILGPEDKTEEFRPLEQAYLARFRPTDQVELDLVVTMLRAAWEKRHFRTMAVRSRDPEKTEAALKRWAALAAQHRSALRTLILIRKIAR